MHIADWIDIEVQIARDEAGDASADALQARDREIAETLDTDTDDTALLVSWAGALRDGTGQRSVGQRVQTAIRIVGTLAALAALALGWAFGEALLAYDGTRPVDAPRYLAVGVGVPAALWLFSVLALVLVRVAPGFARRIPLLLDAAQLLQWGVNSLVTRGLTHADDDTRTAILRARSRNRLYEDAQLSAAIALAQCAAFAFEIGLLASLLITVTVSDIAFAWGTTLEIGAPQLHRLLELLATPWAAIWPSATLDLSLVEATQFTRFDGAFAGEDGSAVLSGAWWRLLAGATLTYGVLPRLLSAGAALWLARRASHAAPVDTPDHRRILRRLRTPLVAIEPVAEDDADGALAAPHAAQRDASESRAESAMVVRWRGFEADDDLLRDHVLAWTSAHANSFADAGGADYRQDEGAQRALRGESDTPVPDHLVLLAESWEPPDRATLAFVRDARTALGASTPITVVLFEKLSDNGVTPASADDARVWRSVLAELEDPYLDILDPGAA